MTSADKVEGLDLAELEKVAREATQHGACEWEAVTSDTFFGNASFVQLLGDTGTGFFQVYGIARDQSEAFANHIATFDPPAVLRLIEANRELLAALKKWTCNACDGSGRHYSDLEYHQCSKCSGSGLNAVARAAIAKAVQP